MATRIEQFEATMNPRAECTEEGCDWALSYSQSTTKAACTQHVRQTGHSVIRVRETRTAYYPDPRDTTNESKAGGEECPC